MRKRNISKLTPAELRIHNLIVQEALRDKEIAAKLSFSTTATRQRVKIILSKVGARSRVHLAILYWKDKLKQ